MVDVVVGIVVVVDEVLVELMDVVPCDVVATSGDDVVVLSSATEGVQAAAKSAKVTNIGLKTGLLAFSPFIHLINVDDRDWSSTR